jgi:hypothetical protein
VYRDEQASSADLDVALAIGTTAKLTVHNKGQPRSLPSASTNKSLQADHSEESSGVTAQAKSTPSSPNNQEATLAPSFHILLDLQSRQTQEESSEQPIRNVI